MNILIGLGNPGAEYQHTRHNSGWMFLDFMAEKEGLGAFQQEKKLHSEISKSSQLLLAKPQTFMNESGKAVQAIIQWNNMRSELDHELQPSFPHLFIIYDDLDIELGKYKIQFGSGPKIHNGLNSIRQVLGTEKFWNVRIGVDNRQGDRSLPGHVYVLQSFSSDEKKVFQETLPKLAKDVKVKMDSERV